MGRDRQWQAIPDDWVIFRLAVEGKRFYDELCNIRHHFERGCIERPLPGVQFAQSNQEEAEFLAALRALRETHPGIEYRGYLEESRMSSSVEWLLERYVQYIGWKSDEPSAENPAAKAIHGAKVLPEWTDYSYYSPPSDVLEIATFLEPITWSALKRHYDPIQMQEEVYKFRDQWLWIWIVCPIFCKSSRFEIEQTGFYRKSEAISWIWRTFDSMRSIYMAAAECEEGVLTHWL